MNDYSEYLNKPGMLAYIEKEWKENPFLHEAHAKIVNEFIKEFKPEKIIEIGCGTGQLASKLNLLDYTGIDSNESCIKIASEKNPHLDFVTFDIRQFNSIRKNGVDLVFSFGFLKHFGLHEWFNIFEKVSLIGKFFIFDIPIADETKDDGTEYHHVWKNRDELLDDISKIWFVVLKEIQVNKDEFCFIIKRNERN